MPPVGSPPPNSCGTRSISSNREIKDCKKFRSSLFQKACSFQRQRRVGHNLHYRGQTLRCAAGSPLPLRCALLPPQGLATLRGPHCRSKRNPLDRRALPAIAVPTCVLGGRKSVKGNHQGSLSRLIGTDFAHRAKSAAAGHRPAAFYKERFALTCCLVQTILSPSGRKYSIIPLVSVRYAPHRPKGAACRSAATNCASAGFWASRRHAAITSSCSPCPVSGINTRFSAGAFFRAE